jgi:micrococcal nuclease
LRQVISAAIACKLAPFRPGTDLLDRYPLMLAAMLTVCAGAGSSRACDGLSDGPEGIVMAVPDGNSVRLDSGIEVELIGTRAPLPAGRSGTPAEPLADAAQAALAALVLGKSVRLGLDDEETDRYGRMQAQVFLDAPDGTWVQQAMLERGMARVEPLPVDNRCLDELLAAEAAARAAGVGIWSDPYYSVRDAADPEALGSAVGHYEVIEGEVFSTGQAGGWTYLDFGRVWKDDFTASIDARAAKRFTEAGIDPLGLTGRRVRIRGWLESRNGPLVELGSPAQIEVLGQK